MNKIKKITFGAMTLSFSLFLGLTSLVGIRSATAPKTMQAKAAGETGLNLIVLGDGIQYPVIDSWNINQGIAMDEVTPGVYSAVIYAGYGQVIVTQKGSWGEHRYYYEDLQPSEITESGDITCYTGGDHNLQLSGNWGYLRFTVDTSKSEYPLSAKWLWKGNGPTIAGPGVVNGQWNCSDKNYIFDTDDGVIFTKTVETVANQNWRSVGYGTSWSTYGGWSHRDETSPLVGDFTEAGDNNFTSTKSSSYVLRYDREKGKIGFYDPNNTYRIKYVYNNDLIGSDVAEGGKAYTPRRYKSDDVNKRAFYYTDAALTNLYDETSLLNADLTLYVKYEDYSFNLYYSTGTTYKWDGGVNIYAWDSEGQSVIGEWPGQEMTYVGGNLCKFTFVGEQDPAGVKFSEKGNDGNQTGDVNFPDGKNVYVYEAAHRGLSDGFAAYDENMMKAEEFAKQFIAATDAGCTSKSFDATTWATVKSAVQGLLDDEDALEVFLDNNGLYKTLGLDDDFIDEALRRYDIIVRKYNVEDFFDRGVSLYSHTIFSTFINNESIPMFIVVLVSAACMGLFFVRRRKETK